MNRTQTETGMAAVSCESTAADIGADGIFNTEGEVQAAEGFDGSGASRDEDTAALIDVGEDLDAKVNSAEEVAPPAPEQKSEIPTPEQVRDIADRLMDDRVRIAIESEVERVRGRFPEIKELGDIVRLKRYPDIKGLVERGYSLSDAVSLTYEDVYLTRRERAAAAQARSGAHSTSHLRATHSRGIGGVDVSESSIRDYMQALPGATREQAIAAYRKYKVGRA